MIELETITAQSPIIETQNKDSHLEVITKNHKELINALRVLLSKINALCS